MYELENSNEDNPELLSLVERMNPKRGKVIFSQNLPSHLISIQEIGQTLHFRQFSHIQNAERLITIPTTPKINLQLNIVYGFFDSSQFFFISQQPFRIYMISKLSQEPIELELEQQIRLQNTIFCKRENNIFIFGWSEEEKENYLCQINLQTLKIKKIQHTKSYGPEKRTKYISMFCDDRLYLFGGLNMKGEQCEKMNWVMDFEKGAWFGLQMDYPSKFITNQVAIHPWDQRKALISVKDSAQLWVFEIHQSRIKEVRGCLEIQEGYYILQFKGNLLVKKGREVRSLRKRITQNKIEKKQKNT